MLMCVGVSGLVLVKRGLAQYIFRHCVNVVCGFMNGYCSVFCMAYSVIALDSFLNYSVHWLLKECSTC